ncbi:MAG: ketoacyl-ACP synthase III [Chloroflexi bacterium]|nr:MAG: ketoacyl-ACP synthase III [Chloroflexota bacterium]
MPAVPTQLEPRVQRAPQLTRHAAVLGTGSFVPDGIISNADLEAMVHTSDAWILERTGIRERRRAGAGVTAATLGAAAGRRALAAAGISEVSAIIVATCSPDTFIPPTACLVQRELGLPGVPAFDINAACSGFVDALVVANSLIVSGAAGTVLVIGAEALTQLVDYTDRSTCVLFGDGAGALVLGAADRGGVVATSWGADGLDADLIYYGVKGDDPNSGDGVRMHGKGTFRNAVERMVGIAEELCATAGWRLDDVDLLVPHQANARIIEAVAKRLRLPMNKVMVNLDRYGNTGGASIALALAEADQLGRLGAGRRVLAIAFGAGATWGGVALEWTSTRAAWAAPGGADRNRRVPRMRQAVRLRALQGRPQRLHRVRPSRARPGRAAHRAAGGLAQHGAARAARRRP